MKTTYYIITLFLFFSCGVPEERYQALENENKTLQAKVDTLNDQLNDLKFGASSLLKKAKLKIDDQDYNTAKDLLTTIVDKYYNSKEAIVAKNLLKTVNPKIEEIVFNKAESDIGVNSLESYIQQYPDGRFVKDAKDLIEDRSWQSLDTNSKAALTSFISTYPNSVHVADAKNLMIKDEVNDVFQTGNYNRLPPLSRISSDNPDLNNSNSKVTIENNTNYLLTILYSGPEQQRIVISNNETRSLWLANGSYRIVAYVNATNVSSYAGEEELNGEYASSYYISSNNSSFQDFNNSQSRTTTDYKWQSTTTTTPTYTPQSNYPVYQVRIGAICCDGTRSNATGKGACSHHNGVCQWLTQ